MSIFLSATTSQTHGAETLASIAGVIGGITVLVYTVRRISMFIRRIVHFLDDWQGEPDRPGVPGRLGVLSRLSAVENATVDNATACSAVSEQLGLVVSAVGELQANGGTTLFDAIHRIEADIANQSGRIVRPHTGGTR